jgi:4-diphosphocytidyl-2-C-methyl-D-erythritol kinase
MLKFTPAKINLGLRILRKREDGFHNLETCFFPISDVCDAVEMLPSATSDLHIQQADWSGPKEANLVWKAMELFRGFEPDLPPLQWHLLKSIPSGAGLGGGSSDAACALRMMAEFSGWKEDDPRLHEMAIQLGSDCAFFLLNRPAIGKGRGEVLELFDLDLSEFRIRLVFPGIHISTAEAFSKVTPGIPEKSLKDILRMDPTEWKNCLVNDFEKSIFPRYPKLSAEKAKLYEEGAVYASMSGSGSALYGIFRK